MTKKIYFASDFHLGVPAKTSSREREQKIVRWLDFVAADAERIYLVGDLFDFWFEYRKAVPKGYTRLLGKMAELSDAGIRLEVFTGNHDLWMSGYFQEEMGIPVHTKAIQFEWQGKSFFVAHGDGLGPNDTGYKLMKKVFTNPACKWLYSWLHPDVGIPLALLASGRSRAATPENEKQWRGDDKEWLYQYCLRKIAQGIEPDYFVFGHRHLPVNKLLPNGRSRYLNLGEWMHACTYGVASSTNLELRRYD